MGLLWRLDSFYLLHPASKFSALVTERAHVTEARDHDARELCARGIVQRRKIAEWQLVISLISSRRIATFAGRCCLTSLVRAGRREGSPVRSTILLVPAAVPSVRRDRGLARPCAIWAVRADVSASGQHATSDCVLRWA